MKAKGHFILGAGTMAGWSMAFQDYLGPEAYISYVREHWVDLPWYVGAIIALSCVIVHTVKDYQKRKEERMANQYIRIALSVAFWAVLLGSLALSTVHAQKLTMEADEAVTASLNVNSVRVEVEWIESGAELDRIATKYGVPDARRASGFSVLGKRDGERVCLIYAYKPEHVDDEETTALGHELLHCLAGRYHR